MENNENVTLETGEVFCFPGPFSKRSKSSQDLSNEFEDTFEEIPPYSVDLVTGDLINKTPDPILKKVGRTNIQERIQSYADDVDLYKILERVALSGDTSLLNRKIGQFGDFVNLPDNLNDFNDYVKKAFEKSNTLPDELLRAALNSSISTGELNSLIAKHVEKAVQAAAQKNNNTNGGQK